MPNTAISVSDLSKKYEDRLAVSHINFEVPLGTVCGFVGPNGSGKTTTMRMLLGLITPTTGQGHILGEPIEHPEKYLSLLYFFYCSLFLVFLLLRSQTKRPITLRL